MRTGAASCTWWNVCHPRPTSGVHGRTCARSPGADSPKRPRAGHPLCHRRRVQVTVEPDALAEWSAHARRTGASLHARLAALDGDLAPLAHTWHGAAADRFAARHRQWQDAVSGAARHADRARRPGRRRPRQLPGRHVGQHRDLAAAGLVDGGRRARDGGGRRPGQGPWTDRGGPRGHPDGGAGPRRRDGGSRRGVERAAHRARRIRRDGGRRRRRGLRRRLRRHGRGGLAGLAPQRADARRDRRRPGRDREQPGRCRGRLDDGPEAAVHRDHGEHRPGARTGPAPDRRRGRRRPGRRVRVLADRGPRPAADGRSHLALVRGGPARHRPPGVRRRGRPGRRPARTWRCGRCGASPARRCPTTPPPA